MKVDPVLAQYVYQIANLPLLRSVSLESPEQEGLVKEARDSYQALSLWLRNILLAEDLSPEAYQGIGRYYQPYAELWAARLDLAIAVHRSTSNLAIKSYSSPAVLWYEWLSELAQQELDDRGITGKPRIVIKAEQYSNISEFCSLWEEKALKPEDFDEIRSLGGLIFAEAQVLADDTRFYHRYLLPFIRVWRRTSRQVRRCKYLQGVCMRPDGTSFSTAKGRKLPLDLR